MLKDKTNEYIAEAMYSAVFVAGNYAYNSVEDLEKYKKLVMVVVK